jgi:hypothetical protein
MASFPDGHLNQRGWTWPGHLGAPSAQNFVSTSPRSKPRAKWFQNGSLAQLLPYW